MARYNNARKTWSYSMEFKVRAVELSHQDGMQVQQVAEGLGIHPFMLSRWRKEYRQGIIVPDRRRRKEATVSQGKQASVQEKGDVARLERENARLRKENALLKKWQRYLAEQHRSGSASSRSTQPNLASDTCADGSVSHAAATTRGGREG